MQTSKKTTAIAIAIFLIVSMGASTILLPAANAHTPSWNIPTFAFINVAPNPVGVGQTLRVNFWLGQPLLNNTFTWYEHSNAAYAQFRHTTIPANTVNGPGNGSAATIEGE